MLHHHRRNLLHRSGLPFPPILTSENDHALAECAQKHLIDKLDLICRRNSGKRSLAVRAKHDIVREINAQSNDILQYECDVQR